MFAQTANVYIEGQPYWMLTCSSGQVEQTMDMSRHVITGTPDRDNNLLLQPVLSSTPTSNIFYSNE